MHVVRRNRLWRKLETLPEEQLYQVLDYIEFLESKYAQRAAVEPSGLQRFAERFEDRMRARDLAPRAMASTMKLFGTAGRVLDNLGEVGQGILDGISSASRGEERGSGRADRDKRREATKSASRA